jgi:hypothetical protein
MDDEIWRRGEIKMEGEEQRKEKEGGVVGVEDVEKKAG